MNENHFDVIVLGGGPAGLSAGIYLSRAKLKTLIINEGTVGGQIVLTHAIANYPGVENISGYMLASIMKNQALSFGCKIIANAAIVNLDLTSEVKTVELKRKGTFTADAVIVATGGRSRKLNVPGEDEFKGRGISYCATCDGDFFQDQNIIVVGGGNSALEEAVALTKYASKVTIVHQFDHFQALKHYVDVAKENDKIDYIMESEIIEFSGDEKLRKVKIEHQRTREITEMEIDGVFVLIGYVPNTEAFKGVLELNERNEIIVDKDTLAANIPGVFAAGDNIAKRYRQITTAVSDGTISALSALEYIAKKQTS